MRLKMFVMLKLNALEGIKEGNIIFLFFCKYVGIEHKTSTAYTPQKNSITEKKNKTLTESKCYAL